MITPQTKHQKMAKILGLSVPLYFKREDLHPLGSHKGRSLPIMIETHAKQGETHFVISSSGNAALAAGLYIKKYNQKHKSKLSLQIFVGEKIDLEKLGLLKKVLSKYITINQTKNPKQQAFKLDKNGEAKILRQSTDDLALLGYEELAKELNKIKNLSAVFIPTSSGTTAQGLYNGFKKFKHLPQIHIVQTTTCHPIAINFSPTRCCSTTSKSIAGAIVDNVAHRKEVVISDIKNSKGFGWIADDKQIQVTIELIWKTEKIKISPNSALAIVGLQEAIKQNWKFKGSVTCLITGK
ncbi:MAG: PLP-dependent lyase/thiolase [Candidatus Magasanikbacteria bacterium]|jgi:threonine synthase